MNDQPAPAYRSSEASASALVGVFVNASGSLEGESAGSVAVFRALVAAVFREANTWITSRSPHAHRAFCSYRTAQHMIPGLENYKLPTVTKALVPGFKLNHHRADSDAEACALVVAALQSRR